MPRANVYIRDENWEVWQALQDKSAWVNDQLQGGPIKVKPRDMTLTQQAAADICTGHKNGMRMDCGRKGCKYEGL